MKPFSMVLLGIGLFVGASPALSIAGEVPSLRQHVQIEDACDFEAERPCIAELTRICGNPPETNPECIKRNSSRLMKKTVSYRKCLHNIYVQCSKGKKCSSKEPEVLCKW